MHIDSYKHEMKTIPFGENIYYTCGAALSKKK